MVTEFDRSDAGWRIEGAFVELEFRGVDGGVLKEVREGYEGGRLFCHIVYGDDQEKPLKNPFVKKLLRNFRRQVKPNMSRLDINHLAISAVHESRLPRFYEWALQRGIEVK